MEKRGRGGEREKDEFQKRVTYKYKIIPSKSLRDSKELEGAWKIQW